MARDSSATKAAKSQESPAKEASRAPEEFGDEDEAALDEPEGSRLERFHLALETLKKFLATAPRSQDVVGLSMRCAPRLAMELRDVLVDATERSTIELVFTKELVLLAEADDDEAFAQQLSKLGARAEEEAGKLNLRMDNVCAPESSSMRRARLEKEARRQEEEDGQLVFAEDAETLEYYGGLIPCLQSIIFYADCDTSYFHAVKQKPMLVALAEELFELLRPLLRAEQSGKTTVSSGLWKNLNTMLAGGLGAAADGRKEFLEEASRTSVFDRSLDMEAIARYERLFALARQQAANRAAATAAPLSPPPSPGERRVLSRGTGEGYSFAGTHVRLTDVDLAELEALYSGSGRDHDASNEAVAQRHTRIRKALRAAGATKLIGTYDEAKLILWSGRLYPDPLENPHAGATREP